MAKKPSRQQLPSLAQRTLDARPDSVDFRDRMYIPTLVDVPMEVPLDTYRAEGVPVLDQGSEGACTGFGLAAVANYLLRTRKVSPDPRDVSPRMLYEMARRYDEWPGEDYAGSSARGAMKGWHKHGVCSEQSWPYRASRSVGRLTMERAEDARHRPLGAYFRVNHKDIVAMHSALAEVGILYATAIVHSGWENLDREGRIPVSSEVMGGHAFAIVAYDRRGFWIQNSWSERWGHQGFAHLSYDDWLAHGTDVWVARLGAPIDVQSAAGTASLNFQMGTDTVAYTFHDIRPHIISIGNDGDLAETGTYGNTKADLRQILNESLADLTGNWSKKRIVLYAHGGLTSERSAIQKVADLRETLLSEQVYPFSFVWRTDYWTTLKNILREAVTRRRTEGFLDRSKDFMLDRLDDALEPLARQLTGKAQWDEMKENGIGATRRARGGGRIFCDLLSELLKNNDYEIHVVGFSAGAIFMAPIVQYLATKGKIKSGPMKGKSGLGIPIASCTLWAPACTIELFNETYQPTISADQVKEFSLFTLTDEVERDDDVGNIYHKSLLYLVSNAFEDRARVPLIRDGVPLLGMEKWINDDSKLTQFLNGRGRDWILAPNSEPAGSRRHSTARHHGDFDDDRATLLATLAHIRSAKTVTADVSSRLSRNTVVNRRRAIEY